MTEQLFNALAFFATAAVLAIVWQLKSEIKTLRTRFHMMHCTLMEFYVNTLSQQIADARKSGDIKAAETLTTIQAKAVSLMVYLADLDGDDVQRHDVWDNDKDSTPEVSPNNA